MRRRAVLFAAVVTGALALLGAGLAIALQGGSQSFAVPAGKTREATVKCDHGHALAGGFHVAIPGGNGPYMLPLDSTREGDDAWRLRTMNQGKAGKATVSVYCAKAGPPLTRASSNTTIAPDEKQSIAAQCPPGAEAVAGGFGSPDARTFLIASKRTASDTWEVTFVNNSHHSHRYSAFAYCDPSQPGLQTKSKTATADGNGEKFSQTVAARCPSGQNLLSGGFQIDYRVDPVAERSDLGLVHASARTRGGRWRLTAFAFLGSPEMTAYAYCH
jgi:hypothetical protein